MRPRFALSLLAGIAVIAGTAACSDDDDGNPPAADVAITSGASSKTTTAYSPNPFELSLATGGEVTWVNADGTDHTVDSDTDVFDSGDMSPNDTFSHTFTAVGTYTYHCSIHPGMVGTIEITP